MNTARSNDKNDDPISAQNTVGEGETASAEPVRPSNRGGATEDHGGVGAEQTQSEADPTAEPREPTLDEQLATAIAERDAHFDKWKRAQADLENYRKRVQRDLEETRRYQALPLVRELLPGLDNLERAIDAAKISQSVEELATGVRMVAQQFEEALAKHNVLPIDPSGQPFDPHRHEAVQQMPSADHEPMTVIQEIQRGYVLNDRVVRPSKVIVSSGVRPEQSENNSRDRRNRNRPNTVSIRNDENEQCASLCPCSRDRVTASIHEMCEVLIRGRRCPRMPHRLSDMENATMPTYDYICGACEHNWEFFQSITAKPVRKCPECGKLRAKRMIGAGSAVLFRGPGFYQTDYRSSSYKKGQEADKKARESSKGKSDSAKAKSSSGSSAESKSAGCAT